MFNSSCEHSKQELLDRKKMLDGIGRFGIDFLDDSLRGIFKDDLILIGAPSGVGKTQLCCNIAYANILENKKVHYIALEASKFEIERRFLYQLVAERFFSDPNRPNIKINFTDWYLGKFLNDLEKYESEAHELFEIGFKNLFLYYKGEKFGIEELIDSVCYCSESTDLIIIDHVHYFDLDDDNENRAIKEIAKTVRTLALEKQKPIILVAHLRKRDRFNKELVPGLEEFHGSSDLYKIATKVITFSPGPSVEDSNSVFQTFFRVAKNRFDGSLTRFLGREFFDIKKGKYESNKYDLGLSSQNREDEFKIVDGNDYPDWGRERKFTDQYDNDAANRQNGGLVRYGNYENMCNNNYVVKARQIIKDD